MTRTGDFNHINIEELRPTFGAQISGVDISKPLSNEVFEEIVRAITKYGVLVFRQTGLTEETHIEFAARFGELDDATPFMKPGRVRRPNHKELLDISNLNGDGTLADPEGFKAQAHKGNTLFHVDSSYNPRRASYSLLLAHELPPPGSGGQTAFADTRTAFDDLPPSLKENLLQRDYVALHSLMHSRKLASPGYYGGLDPKDHPMSRHRIVQRHEPSGRMNLYIASHICQVEGISETESQELVDGLMKHATQEKYVLHVEWENPEDLVMWDNTCLMHRAVGGSYVGKYKRDLRRATVHDSSSWAWGLNDRSLERQGL